MAEMIQPTVIPALPSPQKQNGLRERKPLI